MPRPQRTDRRYHLPPLLRRFGYEPMEHASAKVPSVERHIGDEHETDNGKPDGDHRELLFNSPVTLSRAGTAGSPSLLWPLPPSTSFSERRASRPRTMTSFSGPWLISRPTRNRNSRPSTK